MGEGRGEGGVRDVALENGQHEGIYHVHDRRICTRTDAPIGGVTVLDVWSQWDSSSMARDSRSNTEYLENSLTTARGAQRPPPGLSKSSLAMTNDTTSPVSPAATRLSFRLAPVTKRSERLSAICAEHGICHERVLILQTSNDMLKIFRMIEGLQRGCSRADEAGHVLGTASTRQHQSVSCSS